jgi:hypothetical protein
LWGGVLVHIGLTGLAGAELDHVVIALDEWDQPEQQQVLHSFLQPIGIVAHRLDKQVNPFLGAEGLAFLNVVVQREPNDLKGG